MSSKVAHTPEIANSPSTFWRNVNFALLSVVTLTAAHQYVEREILTSKIEMCNHTIPKSTEYREMGCSAVKAEQQEYGAKAARLTNYLQNLKTAASSFHL